MLKVLALALIIFSASAAPLPPNGGKQNTDASAKTSQPAPTAPSGGHLNVLMSSNEKEKDAALQAHDSHHWKEAFWPASWSNWALAVLAFWAGCLALKNLRKISRQVDLMNRQTIVAIASAKAARASAQAALRNAEAVINAERARILFETEMRLHETFRGVAIFTIFAVNRGKVPAEVINYGKAEKCRTPTNTLPLEPKYQLADPPIVRFVVSGERHAVAEFQPGMPGNAYRQLKDLEGPLPENIADIHLTVYGEVTYKDGISDEVRHSRYCFEWFRESGVRGGRLRPAGPPKYNEYT